jgi:predicted TIM-barrel fold metal-dependent hydrolase
MKKIDIYSHFVFKRFICFLEKESGHTHEYSRLFVNTKSLIDVDTRLKLMDRLGVEKHVLVPLPEIGMTSEVGRDPKLSAEAARICNDEMAGLIVKHPERFGGVAILPTGNSDIMVSELERSICRLNLAGSVFGVGPNLKPPDHPDFDKLFAKAVELEVPIWIHPARSADLPDYIGEQGGSKYQFFQAFSWLFDSTMAMHRIVFSGVFERYPKLCIIIHHHGAMIPYFSGRLEIGIRYFEKNAGCKYDAKVPPPYAEHYKKFYIDTATQYYNPKALQIAVNFFGTDHMLFGSDAPMDASGGFDMGNNADKSVAALQISQKERMNIYSGNAELLMKKCLR